MRVRTPFTITCMAISLAVVLGLPAVATNGTTPGYDMEFSQFLQSQGAITEPSIVIVETRFMRTVNDGFEVREIATEGDFATGFVYNDDGIVVTEYTAVVHAPSTYAGALSTLSSQEADYILIRFADGRTYEAELIGTDSPSALAVLQIKNIEPEDIVPIRIGDSDDVIVGEPILFLGYNWISRSRISYDFGVISALQPKYASVEESTNQYFQINVPQNPGNEGGVVINSLGDVIAIMTDIAPYRDATEIHFGLPINLAAEIVEAILDEGEVHRPWFGFRMLELNPQIERAYSLISDLNGDGLVTNSDRDIYEADTGIDLREALFVVWVDVDSPTGDAGMREGDILMEFNGVPVGTMQELRNQIERYRIGDRVTLEWMRREYAVWDPYIAEITIEYSGQRDDEEE